MDIFSEENKQKVLEHLLNLATEGSNSTCIKLYLDLAAEQAPSETITVDQALVIMRKAVLAQNNETPESSLALADSSNSPPACGGVREGASENSQPTIQSTRASARGA